MSHTQPKKAMFNFAYEVSVSGEAATTPIARRSQRSLTLVKKRSEECTSAYNILDFNTFQFAMKIYKCHIISFIFDLYSNSNHIYFVIDGTKWYHDPENKKLYEDCGYM